ncbi:phosphoribosylamine--glycine ligase [Actinocrinis puniceicyclus]|uniref:Phosphoribosylamine--glycine ligase n=1 Tax=Actinocrinis puniceicyclus TaxID=977794 RepID=A0A8J8BCH6_9ACTN|nr:phosphoribosylamine--glycine ligase [Actinocrinis puniceicyclus]MBS2965122.1 phosphoribosylamine--glycine ligase [Actinocrinis puniceicyclus]
MKILVIGGGGREHAICHALSLDDSVTALYCAPGNPGIAAVSQLRSVDPLDPEAVAGLAAQLAVDLVVVGPEAPLVAGVADAVRAAGIAVFGPSKAAARLEGSKAFSKEVMAAAGVPTAESFVCSTAEEAARALDAFGPPYVVKDDALAAGKGVVVTHDRDAALAHAQACGRVVIEEYLDGPEVSLFALTDGTTVLPLQPAQDFKRAGDDDAGPNTGGMGAYSPLPWAPANLTEDVLEYVLQPTVDELRRQGTPFVGLLYAGLALTKRGVRVIEFNARFGDPETQVVLPMLRTPLAHLLRHAATGTLGAVEPLRWHDGAAVTVVLAAAGYPGSPRGGDRISGIPDAESAGEVMVYHAGTSLDPWGGLISSGGRVLTVTARAGDLAAARDLAYAALDRIELPGSHHRTDIAAKAIGGLIAVP